MDIRSTSAWAVRASDRSAILVRGKDRVAWLNGLVTCELAKLGPNEGAYGLVVEKKGRIQTDFFAVPGGDVIALAVPAELRDSILATLDHYLVMEDAEVEAAELVFFELHGPEAWAAAAALSPEYAGTIATRESVVVASGDAAFAEKLAAKMPIVDDPTWNAIRIERGLPRFGVEVDTTLYPQEASLEKLAVSFDKGCYLGQEVVYMLENRGHVKRKLVALEVDGAVSPGDPVTTPDGAAVGDVKSSATGPTSGKTVAIAMVKWAQTKPGTELRVAGQRDARVRL